LLLLTPVSLRESTIKKLRWLFSQATATFGERPIAGLRSGEICAWRGSLPNVHRFEATHALATAMLH
jgi:hypothetical protein